MPEDLVRRGYKVKSSEESFQVALDILRSKEFWATAKENLGWDNSHAFCCVTDIPLKDLPNHAAYYGTTAIGFSANAIHRPCPTPDDCYEWHPVLYLSKQAVIQPYDEAFLASRLSDLSQQVPDPWIRDGLIQGERATRMLFSLLIDSVKFTEFSSVPGESFYQEREWRHIGNWKFDAEDVEIFVVPEGQDAHGQSYVRQAKQFLAAQGMDHVSVIAWDTLERA